MYVCIIICRYKLAFESTLGRVSELIDVDDAIGETVVVTLVSSAGLVDAVGD